MAKKEKKVANKENSSKDNKNKKSFFKGLKAELKKVIWPTPKQLLNNTIAVITIVLITTVIVFVLDLAFESLNKYGVDKIKESIQTITDENSTTDSSENTTTEGESTDENTTGTTEGESTENQTTSESAESGETSANEEQATEGTDATQESSENSVE